jgi:chromosomal replication initiation ATPase DnaA
MKGAAIISAVAEKHGFSRTDLLGPGKSRALSAARREAALTLKQERFSLRRIARLLGIHPNSVCHQVYPHYREKALQRRREARAA